MTDTGSAILDPVSTSSRTPYLGPASNDWQNDANQETEIKHEDHYDEIDLRQRRKEDRRNNL